MSCNTILRQKGLKLTPQRRLILDILHKSSAHISAEDIIQAVQKKMPGVNKSTIYRTLDLLQATGCVYKSEAKDQVIYHHVDEGHHHHMVCTQCGRTLECEENIFEPVERVVKEKFGFQIDFRHIVMQGLCKECAIRGD